MSKVLKNEEKFSRWESREGVELWMSLAGLQNGRRAWWRDARLLWRDGVVLILKSMPFESINYMAN